MTSVESSHGICCDTCFYGTNIKYHLFRHILKVHADQSHDGWRALSDNFREERQKGNCDVCERRIRLDKIFKHFGAMHSFAPAIQSRIVKEIVHKLNTRLPPPMFRPKGICDICECQCRLDKLFKHCVSQHLGIKTSYRLESNFIPQNDKHWLRRQIHTIIRPKGDCDVCHRRVRIDKMFKHSKAKHLINIKKPTELCDISSYQYTCDICGLNLSWANLATHMETLHNLATDRTMLYSGEANEGNPQAIMRWSQFEKYGCDECGKLFMACNKHMLIQHVGICSNVPTCRDPVSVPSQNGSHKYKYICDNCQRVYRLQYMLIDHLGNCPMSTDKLRLMYYSEGFAAMLDIGCDYCSYITRCKWKLNRHIIKLHGGEYQGLSVNATERKAQLRLKGVCDVCLRGIRIDRLFEHFQIRHSYRTHNAVKTFHDSFG